MRVLLTVFGVLVLGIVLFAVVIIVASESGEVVTLTTLDETGRGYNTRLWVVDYQGEVWVRTGHPDKPWFKRMLGNSTVSLLRRGDTSERCAVPVQNPTLAERVNQAFAEKYGIADRIVALSGDASKRIPVRLDERMSAWHSCSITAARPGASP